MILILSQTNDTNQHHTAHMIDYVNALPQLELKYAPQRPITTHFTIRRRLQRPEIAVKLIRI